MRIRQYRRALPNLNWTPATNATEPSFHYEEIFVILETPLLEFTQKDLAYLRLLGIDPFGS